MNNLVPIVIEKSQFGERAYDIFSRLLKDRIIFLGAPIDDTVASLFTAQLIFLEHQDPRSDISIYINSPGGEVYSMLAMYDTMQYVKPKINTICIGMAASAASLILAAGTKGKRMALPHSRIMIHQPSGGASGQATDIEIQAREIKKIREISEEIFHKHTGQPLEKIRKDIERDYFMSAEEAKEYGIIDEIIETEKS